ncbi:ABC transporter ATP-binding protein [Brucella haematophila]|uniref:Sn-glycerol-3-phosphate ABC transporter ATP-binding protein UgpC n=1 Tax=Brucella haematophila TaxID=419474 RepID=A0ABX1DWE0_9HYPH|nr:sn-glycerol-3-phosphate ABC transporter ATP-binding protein UgpC [Brucella haematophila]NKC05075.1 sn-glycerol-3-phosphate ABC transporter ATP-binding protein UgpC [Brucella haematophila]TMV04364.1 sn-glycerol-3-phosphate ABC transporter ATP-binding protein UgpC [Brucella haematophila]
MGAVELRGLKKSYGQAQIVHGIDLTVEEGEFLALVGPSGCGKSTLLRMVAGLETISSGEIVFDGKVVNSLDPKQRNVAMVFQNYALYPHMTVRENMSLNLRLSKVSKTEIEKRVEDAARLLHIDAILERRPSQLSGGQRQRVAMGRAIVRNPAVFLFDEPLSNLDAKLRVMMRAEIKALHQKVKTTSIYVTHDQIEAMTLADRIAVLNAGKIEQIGTPIELYNNPSNKFVAGFIGSPAMNFIPGRVERGYAVVEKLSDGFPSIALADISDGTPLEFGVRPEHLRLSDNDHGLPATVQQVDQTGSQTHVVADALGSTVTVVLEGMVMLNVGDSIKLTTKASDIYLFESSGGKAVGPRPEPRLREKT